MPARIDLTGRRFGELTVIGLASEKIAGRPAWTCVCDCGKSRIARGDTLRIGDITTCGQHRSASWLESKRGTQHNRVFPKGSDSKSRIYTVWNAMMARCYRPSHEAYMRYGAAGIEVCDDWRTFAGFRKWALASGYSEELSLDRINNEAGYSPANCRWATRSEQARNRTSAKIVSAFGEKKLLVEWSEDHRCLVSEAILRKRIAAGHDAEFAMTASEHEIRSRSAKLRDYGLARR